MSIEIEKLIEIEDWDGARLVIESDLLSEPDNHWLLIRLSLTYYEQRDYAKALEVGRKAMEQDPNCPLVLWNYAGTLQMLDREKEAIELYSRLIKRGVNAVAHDSCGEGVARATALLLDCHYRRALSLLELNRKSDAEKDLEYFIKNHPSANESIYTVEEAEVKLSAIWS